MGAFVNYSNRVEFTSKKWNQYMNQINFDHIQDDIIQKIIQDSKINYIQISDYVPTTCLNSIHEILKHRPDITFRIYGFYQESGICDLSFLKHLPSIQKLSIDYIRNVKNIDVLKTLNLESLRLYIFDCKDYSIMNELTSNLKSFHIHHELNKINFDCQWLLRYPSLHELYLGKASKNIECLKDLKHLNKLTLRGIKLKSLEFLKESTVTDLSIHWCSMNDLSTLSHNHKLLNLELWRILKLEDLSFITTLTNLRSLHLQDLTNITTLPDFSNTQLQKIYIDNLKNLVHLDSLKNLSNLEALEIIGSKNIELIEWENVLSNPALTTVDIYGAGNKSKVEKIEELLKHYKKKSKDD